MNLVEARFDAVGFVNSADTNKDKNLSGDEIVNLMNRLSKENTQLANEKYNIMDKMANDAFNGKNIPTLKMIKALRDRQTGETQQVTSYYDGQKYEIVEDTRNNTTIEKTSSRFLSVAKAVDLNNTGRIGKTEVKKYISTISDQNMKAAISHAWNENWEIYGNEGIPVKEFASMIEKKYESYKQNNVSSSVKKHNESREYKSLPISYKAEINDINSTQNIADRYIKQLKLMKKILGDYENITGINDIISKHIGVFGAIAEMSTNEKEGFIRSIVDGGKANKILSKCSGHPALLSTVVTALISLALSGGTSVTVNLFGIRLSSNMIRVGKIKDILKRAGLEHPVTLADVTKHKNEVTKSQAEEISRLTGGKHFDGGGESQIVNQLTYGSKTPSLFIKVFANLFTLGQVGHKEFTLLKEFQNPNTNAKRRKQIARELDNMLSKRIRGLDIQIAKMESNENSGNPLSVLDTRGSTRFEDREPTKEDLIRDRNKLKEVQKGISADIVNSQTDIVNLTKEDIEIANEAKNLARELDTNLGLNSRGVLRTKHGRYGLAIPSNGIGDSWLKQMETYSNNFDRNSTALSYILAMGNVLGELGDNIKNISLGEIEQAFKNGKFMLPEDKLELQKNAKNMSTSGKWNTKFKNYGYYEIELGGHKLYIKSNCSNVQDTTPDGYAYVEKGQYYTVSATYKFGHKKIVERSKTHKENHKIEKTKKVPEYGERIKYKDKEIKVPDHRSNPGVNGNKNVPGSKQGGGTAPSKGPHIPKSKPGINKGVKYHKEIIKVPDGVEKYVKGYKKETYFVDNWVDVTKSWPEIVKVSGKIDALQSVIGSILASSLNNDVCQREIETTLIKDGINENIAKEYAKKLIKYRTAKGVSRPKSVPIKVPYNEKIVKENMRILKEHPNEKIGKNLFYIVKPGDTLSKIAKENYTTVQDLKELNNIIKDVNKIRPGQKIYLHKEK